MHDNFDSAIIEKRLCDIAIADFKLEYVYQEIFSKIFNAIEGKNPSIIIASFEYYSAFFLKFHFAIYIDNLLVKPDECIELDLTSFFNEIKERVDQYFVQFVNTIKRNHRDNSAIIFFRKYHRRDIKQSALFRAFVIVRNRLRASSGDSILKHSFSLIFENPFESNHYKIILKVFFNPFLMNVTSALNDYQSLLSDYYKNAPFAIPIESGSIHIQFADITPLLENISSLNPQIINSNPIVSFDAYNNLGYNLQAALPDIFQVNYFSDLLDIENKTAERQTTI